MTSGTSRWRAAARRRTSPGITFWFTAPNVLCLVVFAWFAGRVRKLAPDGFTLPGYIRERYSKRVQSLYLLQMISLAACSFAVQLLAGGKALSFIAEFLELAEAGVEAP